MNVEPDLAIRVFCTLQFEGYHCWPNAPAEVAFLRTLHRHVFHVRAEKRVLHNDRDVEFILLKNRILETIGRLTGQPSRVQTWSCERWAQEILITHDLDRVEVTEDGENGAIVERA